MTAAAQITLTDREHAVLADREHEVLIKIATGKTYLEISHELRITEDTVKGHAHKAFRKLGARNGPHAVHIAHEHGLIGGHQ